MTNILTWPFDSLPEMRSFRLRPFNISAIAGQSQEIVPGGLIVQRYEPKMVMPDLSEERWREHDGIFADLAGIGGKIRLWDPARTEPYYNQTVTPTVTTWDDDALWSGGAGWAAGHLPPFVTVGETASRGATNLLIKGFPASLSGVLRRGDLFEIRPNGIPADHGHLYTVTRWANSNASGESRVYFKRGLLKGVRPGDQICIGGGGEKPMSVFRLASDDEGDIEVRETMIGSFGVSFTEVLPIA